MSLHSIPPITPSELTEMLEHLDSIIPLDSPEQALIGATIHGISHRWLELIPLHPHPPSRGGWMGVSPSLPKRGHSDRLSRDSRSSRGTPPLPHTNLTTCFGGFSISKGVEDNTRHSAPTLPPVVGFS